MSMEGVVLEDILGRMAILREGDSKAELTYTLRAEAEFVERLGADLDAKGYKLEYVGNSTYKEGQKNPVANKRHWVLFFLRGNL